MFLLPDNPISSPLFIAIIAILLLIAAQSFINQMLEGDQGLGAFLKDGKGYNKSGYRPATSTRIAGQQQSLILGEEVEVEEDEPQQRVYEELERLRLKLNIELEKNSSNINSYKEEDLLEATRLRKKIERLMKIYGIEYETE
ncbi:hypothetical protein FRACYDRAFT_250965 [Fragilariopsis cylindrus CCMP1102]|uniref:Uncharacterized protein n=1 Tax=Fragilariopsis cylindrus CCMP1102 TaxID=635003 RepID=A0A1E7ENK4_9STRA|nr:hypothetical protein FRACYDRAFT_250965 [Fragilariopsis cylindrus CCMP1102]|eukprot:OEU07542.1 hypothetical protein FRACYDRAFT_250965 [Fragilariopsis cylindrus CCMP1102]